MTKDEAILRYKAAMAVLTKCLDGGIITADEMSVIGTNLTICLGNGEKKGVGSNPNEGREEGQESGEWRRFLKRDAGREKPEILY